MVPRRVTARSRRGRWRRRSNGVGGGAGRLRGASGADRYTATWADWENHFDVEVRAAVDLVSRRRGFRRCGSFARLRTGRARRGSHRPTPVVAVAGEGDATASVPQARCDVERRPRSMQSARRGAACTMSSTRSLPAATHSSSRGMHGATAHEPATRATTWRSIGRTVFEDECPRSALHLRRTREYQRRDGLSGPARPRHAARHPGPPRRRGRHCGHCHANPVIKCRVFGECRTRCRPAEVTVLRNVQSSTPRRPRPQAQQTGAAGGAQGSVVAA